MQTETRGWYAPAGTRKWHYFADGHRSLCNKYLLLGKVTEFENGNDDSPDNCSACKRKLKDGQDRPGKT